MTYQVVENFKGGLDLRRAAVAGDPGTLQVGTNVVLSRGGEIEKRKRWVSTYSLSGANAGITFGYLVIGSTRYVFGSSPSVSAPSGITYQRLPHPDYLTLDPDMTAVLFVEAFDGKPYVVAEYEDASIHHFYDGALITDWEDGKVTAAMSASNDLIATHLANVINTGQSVITATSVGAVITLTGAASGAAFTVSTDANNVEGGTDDQTATVAAVTPAVPAVDEVLAVGSFTVTGGTSSAGTNNIDAALVDGIVVLGAAVDWTTSNSGTATLVAAQITSNTSSPNYTATADGPVVLIEAVAGSGASPNGFAVDVTIAAGDVTVASKTAFSGGVNAAAGVAQVSTVTIGGTPEEGDSFTIYLDDEPLAPFGTFSRPAAKGTTAMTYGTKVYSCAGSLIEFSGVNAPTVWSSSSIPFPGAGNINLANEHSGSDDLTGTGRFQNQMAIFSRNDVQIWTIDPDPDLNAYLRTLENTGTRSARSITSYGNADTFYLSDTGVRSIRPRTNTDTAAVDDIGSPIDPEIVDYLKTLTDTQIENAAAEIDPESGRFLLALGARIYVFSYFPSAKVSAWSRWEISVAEGADNEVEWFAIEAGRLYARAGDTIYAYGGIAGTTYGDDDEVTATATLPFMDARKPGHVKQLKRFDVATSGEWTVQIMLDPNDTSVKSIAAVASGITWNKRDGVGLTGKGTHFAPTFTHTKAGAAKIINLGLHFDIEGSKTEVVT